MAVAIYNRQRKVRVDLAGLRRLGALAEQHVRATVERPGAVLPILSEVEISLVSDSAISRVHADFMHLPEPTDVITFQHGEIVISVETAARQAQEYRRSLEEELALYVIHGLLHLHGYLDKTAADFARMQRAQEKILAKCLR